MPLYKPSAATWDDEAAPAGCQGYWPLDGAAGAMAVDLSRAGNHAPFVGTPAWGSGLYGSQLGGFTASNYALRSLPATLDLAANWPIWMAVLVAGRGSSDSFAFALGNHSANAPFAGIRCNYSGVGHIDYYFRDSSGGGPGDAFAGVTKPDGGAPHVIAAASRSATDHRLYFDGLQVDSSGVAAGSTLIDRVALGALVRTTTVFPFGGNLIAGAWGYGALPDFAALAADWLAGRFAAATPELRIEDLFAPAAAGGPFPFFADGDAGLAGGLLTLGGF